MSPRSLLFSSDEETSRLLIQALKEMELATEYCPDIFGAVERLTGRSFDVIVADLDNGPEAGFLLRTASELNVNKGALAVAVSSGSAKAGAHGIRADLMLTKPITNDQVKYAFLSCDRFLAKMRVWLGKPDSARVPQRTISKRLLQASLPRQSPKIDAATRPAKPSPVSRKPVLGTAVPSTLLSAQPPAPVKPEIFRSRIPAATKPILNRRSSGGAEARPGHSKFLWTTAVSAACLALLYGSARPGQIRRVSGSMATVVRHVLEKTYEHASAIKGKLGRPEDSTSIDSAALAEATTNYFPMPEVTRTSSVRLFPVRRSAIPDHAPSVVLETPPAGMNAGQDGLSTDLHGIQIPKSIELPQPDIESLHSLTKGPGPSLLSELQPVSLSEDLSEQLLVQKVQPSYPEQALKIGLQGAVVLQAWIGQDGTIRDLKLVHGSLLLGQAAYHAVKQWRYKPYVRNGRAVEAMTYVTVNFTLPSQSLLSPYPH
jgi:TonB family protein